MAVLRGRSNEGGEHPRELSAITAASGGLGESTARVLAENGPKVVLGARRKDRIDAVVKDITGNGGSPLGFRTDVTTADR
jgi:NADP-dependent 3-hydroxy acid dehydrogenase YdfG